MKIASNLMAYFWAMINFHYSDILFSYFKINSKLREKI